MCSRKLKKILVDVIDLTHNRKLYLKIVAWFMMYNQHRNKLQEEGYIVGFYSPCTVRTVYQERKIPVKLVVLSWVHWGILLSSIGMLLVALTFNIKRLSFFTKITMSSEFHFDLSHDIS